MGWTHPLTSPSPRPKNYNINQKLSSTYQWSHPSSLSPPQVIPIFAFTQNLVNSYFTFVSQLCALLLLLWILFQKIFFPHWFLERWEGRREGDKEKHCLGSNLQPRNMLLTRHQTRTLQCSGRGSNHWQHRPGLISSLELRVLIHAAVIEINFRSLELNVCFGLSHVPSVPLVAEPPLSCEESIWLDWPSPLQGGLMT